MAIRGVSDVMRGWGELAKITSLDANVGASLIAAAASVQNGTVSAERAGACHMLDDVSKALGNRPDPKAEIDLQHRSMTDFDDASRAIQDVVRTLTAG
jgi:hypothetical protein